MSPSPSPARRVGLLAVVLALLGGALAALAPAPATAADPGGGTTLTVQLGVLNQPVWGEDLQVKLGTTRSDAEGSVSLYLLGADDTRTLLLSSADEGTFTVPTADLPPGQHRLVATALKDGLSAESLVRTATVDRRPTTVTFLDSTSAAGGRIRVQLGSGDPRFVPTGTVRVSMATMNPTLIGTDSQGVASFSFPPIGSYDMTFQYLGNDHYAGSTGVEPVTVTPYRSTPTGELSREVIAAGDPVSLTVTVTGGDAQHRPVGTWSLWAKTPGSTDLQLVQRGSYDDSPVAIDLTSWARDHVGTWQFHFDFVGNQYVSSSSSTDLATLTVGPADQRAATETTIEVPATGVPAGGLLTVRVGSATGSPSGPVILFAAGPTQVAAGTVVDGVAQLRLPASIAPGRHEFWATYGGSEAHQGSTSATMSVPVEEPEQSLAETTTEIVVPAAGIPTGGEVVVTVSSSAGLPSGPVVLTGADDTVLATGTAVDGVARIVLPASVTAGVHELRAAFGGSATHRASASAPTSVTVVPPGTGTPRPPATAAKVASTITGRVVGKRRKAVVTVAVGSSRPVSGRVQVRVGKKAVRTVTLSGGRAKVTVKRLRKGKHRVTVTYLGSATVAGARRTWKVKVR
ncbi:MAG TPA: Ig-like domain-containing protein [Acidimicrobiales bacterium]